MRTKRMAKKKRTKRMATIFVPPSSSPSPGLKTTKVDLHQNFGVVKEEIEGLIKVYKDGHVERPEIVPCVSSALPPELGVISRDIVIDKSINIWARFYAPTTTTTTSQQQLLGNNNKLLPLLVYFHGGGFCVGSAAWSCYHEFLSKLASKSSCLIMSVNYRLAPENPLPAAYEDGFKALLWLKQTALNNYSHHQWWTRHFDFSRIFLLGDSAGANIAHNLAKRINSLERTSLRPLSVKGVVLLQPFFGGETRTSSEKSMVQAPPRRSALSLAASDTYWRLALPAGANRDHPWCNPLGKMMMEKVVDVGVPMLVCVSEMDILRDRNLEFCSEMGKAGKKVDFEMFRGVGHAFQVLSKSQISQTRSFEMLARIKDFVSRC